MKMLCGLMPRSSAFSRAGSISSPWPRSAVKVTTSQRYVVCSHFRMIEVSEPPEYASTTSVTSCFLRPPLAMVDCGRRRRPSSHRGRQGRPRESAADYRGNARRCKQRGELISPYRSGGGTQRIEARLLFIAQRIVELRERRLHGLHRGERGIEPLLHRLDPTRGGERLVGRAIDLEAFRRLDRRILQFVERGPLRWHGLDGLGDAIDRQVGHGRRLLIAKPREIELVLCRGVGIIRRRDGVEARLLLVAERLVE